MNESAARSGDTANRVKNLLNDALDLPEGERESYLRKQCQGEPELYDEVAGLLAFSEEEPGDLDAPATWTLPREFGAGEDTDERIGTRVGSFRLERVLGSGGMGRVFLASRVGDVEGDVAIKLIKRGMDSDAVESRFRMERQVLARLSHRNIAHFIDGGIADDGRPYFVMEYVDGEPIHQYVEARKLSVEEKIRLFLQVLEAVDYAHKAFVIHRDLKPSNILVTPSGHPKLLDFGIAKVLDEDAPSATLTEHGGRVLTPSYASPEQVRGELLSTASDVYSLGVVLYEMLTGRKPFYLDHAPLMEVQEVVSRSLPAKPSTNLSTEHGEDETSTRRLKKKLTGDLDAIILKALRKEPDGRYASVSEFHSDLCRFLDGRPVSARKGSTAYRVRKFFARHRTVTTAALLVFLVGGIGGGLFLQQRAEATRQRLLAEQRVEDVRSLVNTLAFEVHDEVAGLAGSTRARQLILNRAFEQLEAVRQELPDDPNLLMSLAGIYRRLGDVQGNPNGPSLGDLTAARASYSEGLRLADRAIALDPENLVRSRGLGLLHERFAATLAFSGEIQEGVEGLRAALDVYRTIAEAYPDSVRHQLTYVIGRINLSDHLGHPSYPNLDQPDEAVTGYREAASRLESGALGADMSSGVLRFRGLVQERLGRMLRVGGDLEGALLAEEASLAIREDLYAQEPSNDDIHRDVGVSHQNVCSIKVLMGRAREAEADCDQAAALYEQRFLLDSLNAGNLRDMTLINRTYEELFLSAGDTTQALAHLRDVVRWSDRRLVLDGTSLLPKLDRIDALLTTGLIQAARGDSIPDFPMIQAQVEELQAEGHLSDYDLDRYRELEEAVSGG